MIRIVVEMKGGLIQNVFSPDWPDAQVIAVDWDALEDVASAGASDPVGSLSPIDAYTTIHPVTSRVVDAVDAGEPLTVAQAQALFDALDQEP